MSQRKHHGNSAEQGLRGTSGVREQLRAGDGIQVVCGHPRLELITECFGLGLGTPQAAGGGQSHGNRQTVKKEHTDRSSWQRREVGEPAEHPPAESRKRGYRPVTMPPTALPTQENQDHTSPHSTRRGHVAGAQQVFVCFFLIL